MKLSTIYSEAAAEIVCKPYLVGEYELGRLAQQSSCDFLKFLESQDLDMKSCAVLEILYTTLPLTLVRKRAYTLIHTQKRRTTLLSSRSVSRTIRCRCQSVESSSEAIFGQWRVESESLG